MSRKPAAGRSRINGGERSLRRAREILRREGPRSFWFKLLGETVYRRMDLIERDIDGRLQPAAGEAEGLEFGLLAPAQVEEFLAFRDYAPRSEVLARLARGERCFLVRDGGRLVHCCWAAAGRSRIDYLDANVVLSNGTVYVYEAYTAPSARGRSISSLRSGFMERYLREQGCRRLVAVIWPENRPVYRSMEKAGYRLAGRLGWRGVGRWRRYFLRHGCGAAPLALATGPAPQSTGRDWDRVPARLESGQHYLDPFLAALKRRENLRLAREWGGRAPGGRLLKTDAFEEAMGEDAFLEALEGEAAQILAIDLSQAVARKAAERYRGRTLRFLAADVRRLPFEDAAFSIILSPSTLDHFPDPSDLAVSLRELFRVLQPGGRLVITLDNRQNILDPLLRLVHRMGLVPFYMGRSYRVGELRRELEAAGFEVRATTAILHNPRLVAVATMRLVRWLRWPRLARGAERLFLAAQRLEHTRLRYYTGSFVAAQAVRPGVPATENAPAPDGSGASA